jgi:uncharacterized integral membrane protein
MRLVRFLFLYILASAFGIALFLLLVQNVQKTRLVFYGREYSISLAWVLIGAAVFGGLLMLILLLPGRLAANVNNWRLEREIRQVEQELARLQERRERLLDQHAHMLEAHDHMLIQHQRLVAEHSRVVAERDQVRKQLIIASTTAIRTEASVAGKRTTISQSSTVVAAAAGAGAHGGSTRAPSSVLAGPAEGRAGEATTHIAPDTVVHTAPHKAARDADRPVAHTEHQPAAGERALVPIAAPRTPVQPVREQPPASAAPPVPAPKLPTPPAVPVLAPAPVPVPALASVPVPATVQMRPAAPTFASEQRAKAARAIRSQAQQLTVLRDRLREDLVGVRVTLEAQVERLKQSSSRLRGPSTSAVPGSDDQGHTPRESDTSPS